MGFFRKHLVWKLLGTYLLVILVGGLVLAVAVELIAPPTFDRHMLGVQARGQQMGMMRMENLLVDFRAALNDVLLLAAVAAFVVAAMLSVILARQVVKPVSQMTMASRRISEGQFEQRVQGSMGEPDEEGDELDQLAHSFNLMAAQLEQTERRRRELLGNVSHELRTPLTAIKGSMEGLIDGVLPANAETFQDIYQEADRLQRLVNDLEELSRVEGGALDLALEPTSLGNLTRSLKKRLSKQFSQKGIDFKIELPAELPKVLADEDRCMQVLFNLCVNALHYTPKGGKVRVSAAQVGDSVQVTVADTGMGIPAEHLPHLFQRFYRVDKSRSRNLGGSGIGLTIAKHLVEAQGGHIWAESAGEGLGSSFHFTLPLAE